MHVPFRDEETTALRVSPDETLRRSGAYIVVAGAPPLNCNQRLFMWAILKWLAMRIAIVRWIFKILALLSFLPIAFLLKAFGLPILIVLAVLALPVLFLLALFGLPLFLVLLAGGLAMGVLFAALAFGLFALKIAIFVVLPAWLLWRLASWVFRGRDRREAPSQKPAEGADSA